MPTGRGPRRTRYAGEARPHSRVEGLAPDTTGRAIIVSACLQEGRGTSAINSVLCVTAEEACAVAGYMTGTVNIRLEPAKIQVRPTCRHA